MTERRWEIVEGDCLAIMRDIADGSVDAIVTDPPYGLGFMGKAWDGCVPPVDVWRECLRILKPGGHLLAFAGTRTQHRMACAIEDAGFEIRDMLAWVYGSGFPKSLDVSKAIDKAAGAEREVVGQKWAERYPNGPGGCSFSVGSGPDGTRTAARSLETAPATEAAKRWHGWGTALKPALEPITLARRPIGRGTVAANVVEHGTGALNVEACRVGDKGGTRKTEPAKRASVSAYGDGLNGGGCEAIDAGRWPANLVHDGSREIHDLLGSAARFFYCAKANKKERNAGLGEDRNKHPTVKPIELMRWLCRLITPPGGIVLDPFVGTGTTGCAALLEGFLFVGIEREPEYCTIARQRLEFQELAK